MEKVNVKDKFSLFQDRWSPKIAGALNNQQVKLAKLFGEFIWHSHEHEDELFYIIKGQLNIEFRDKTVTLDEGEFIIVPRGVEHKPVAMEEAWVLFFEPASTVNTGDLINEKTKLNLETI